MADQLFGIGAHPAARVRLRDVPLALQFPTEPLASDPCVSRPPRPTVGYLWDNAWAHGVRFRDYAEYATIPGDCSQPVEGRRNVSNITHLRPQFNTRTRSTPATTSRVQTTPRASRSGGRVPRLRGDRDAAPADDHATPQRSHTRYDAGRPRRRPTWPTTTSPSGSWSTSSRTRRYWTDTAIFVTEDDAQNGPDHVDAHRTVALLISA